MFSRKRKAESPLVASVNRLVSTVCKWEDACGGKYTVDTKTVIGSDFVSLDIKGVDEIRTNDVLELVEQDAHIAKYLTLSFVFESHRRKARNAQIEQSAAPLAVINTNKDKEALENELKFVRPHVGSEAEDDLVMIYECVVAVRKSISILNSLSQQVAFDYTSTPGLIRITVRGLAKIETKLFTTFKKLRDEFDAHVVLVVSPKTEQCVQISVKKGNATVNI
jgi:hypothetical protein